MGMKVNGTSGLTFPDTTTLGSAGQSSVQAWVNFNGTGTVAIRANFNVASITDNGVGDYTVNFTTALVDANYAVSASTQSGDAISSTRSIVIRSTADSTPSTTMLTGSVRLLSGNTPFAALIDSAVVCVSIFR